MLTRNDNKIDEILAKKRDYNDFDWEAIEAIIGNCKSSEYEDCKRLLLVQKDEIIEKIYYELMFDKNGDENDFIPSLCNYDTLLGILKSLGGIEEVLSEKKERKVKQIINQYKGIIHGQEEIIQQNNMIINTQEKTINTHKLTIIEQKKMPKKQKGNIFLQKSDSNIALDWIPFTPDLITILIKYKTGETRSLLIEKTLERSSMIQDLIVLIGNKTGNQLNSIKI